MIQHIYLMTSSYTDVQLSECSGGGGDLVWCETRQVETPKSQVWWGNKYGMEGHDIDFDSNEDRSVLVLCGC